MGSNTLFHFCRWVRTELKQEEVLLTFIEKPQTSVRMAQQIDGMPSKSTIHRILKDEKFHPYRIQLHQQLRPQDCQRRVEHSLTQLALMEVDHSFLFRLLFSDEAHFYVNGIVNHQNFRYWSPTNPQITQERPLHSPRVTVWAAIGSCGVIGPFFIHENVTGQSYLALLQQQFLPAVQQFHDFNSVVFMQDGAPPHWSRPVREWLSVNFPNRWMGRSSPNLPWPPYSPDLTPMDFFLWGWMKDVVYQEPIANVEVLEARIRLAFQQLTMDMVDRSVQSYVQRLHRCIEREGRSVE